MTQDDRRDDSNRWLDQQYDRAEEERRRAARAQSDYKAILDRNPSRLRDNAGMDPPRPDIGAASGDLFDAVLAAHRQLQRDAPDVVWIQRIYRLDFSRFAECQAEIANLCRLAENEGSGLAAALRRFGEIARVCNRRRSDIHVSNRSLISSMANAVIDEWRGSMTMAWPR
jgi:hypothetical protein